MAETLFFCCVRSGWTKVVKLGCAEHHVGGRAVGGRDAVVDQDAIVLRVGDVEPAVLNPNALRAAHATWRSASWPTGLVLVKSGWPTTTSAGWLLMLGMRFQMSTRLWSVSATTTCTPSDATAVGRRRALRCGREIQGRRGEIGLAEHDRGLTDADRALAVVGQLSGGLGNMRRGVLEEQDAMIGGSGADAVGVGHEQGVGGERQSAGAADDDVAGIRVLAGEGGLTDDQPGGLPRGEVGALAKRVAALRMKTEMHFMRNSSRRVGCGFNSQL